MLVLGQDGLPPERTVLRAVTLVDYLSVQACASASESLRVGAWDARRLCQHRLPYGGRSDRRRLRIRGPAPLRRRPE